MPVKFGMLRRVLALTAVALGFAAGQTAYAQAGPYSNTTARAIDDTVTCGAGSFTRTITVADSFTVTDVDVGFLASHSWRGDIRVDLTHGGVTRRIITSDTSNAADEDNYNVRLDDSATDTIRTGSHTTNDGLVAPPYENTVRPNTTLAAFNGQNATGNWVFTICDDFNGSDDGNFLRADLFFPSPTAADLSLDLTHTPTNPAQGTNVTFTATISNAGAMASTGRTAQINLPTGFTFVSATGGATHSAGIVTWTPGTSLASGGSENITITATMNFTGSYEVTGEITAAGQADPDSTPGDGINGDDDDVTVTVVPSVAPPPALSCGAAAIVHDWDVDGWTAGDLTNSYTTSGEPIVWTVSGDTGALQVNPTGGTALPDLSDYDSGGLVPTEDALLYLVDFTNRSSAIVTTVDIGVPGTGVDEAQFALFDVDYATGQFEDRILVTGSLGGMTVLPTLTRSASNTVSGNTALGTAGANNDTDLGTITVTFQSPVDQFVISYGSGTDATTPANPGQQAMSIHDVSTCVRTLPDIAAVKTTDVYDPLAEGLYAIPGNDVVYTFTITNSGTGATDANSMVLIDVMPDEIEFYNGDIDDGGPQTNPVTFAQTGTPSLTFNYASDVGFSNAATKPADFAACSYAPSAGYDPNVNFICFNPKGTFASGSPDPEFTLQFRARIK